MVDFNNKNILDFIPTKGWSEEQKVSFGLKFVELFFVFLAKSLDEKLPEDTDTKFEELLNSKPSEQQVTDFYNQLLPNLGIEIENLAIKFKKIFLLNLYSDKLTSLENSEDPGAYKNWEKINEFAKADRWDEVIELTSQLK